MRRVALKAVAVLAIVLFAGPAVAQGLTPLPQLAPFPGAGTVLTPGVGPPPPAVPVPGPAFPAAGGGDWFDSFVNDIGGDTAPWTVNATQLMYILFNVLLVLAIVVALAKNAAQNQSIAGWGHLFPSMLMDLLFPWSVVYAAPVFVSNALAVGLGAGSYITGSAIVGPNAMAWAFFHMIQSMLGAPFASFGQPMMTWQDAVFGPGRVAMGIVEFIVALGFAAIAGIIGGACVLMLVFVQVDCLVIMPITLLLVPFVVAKPMSGLWQGAVQTWFRRVLRLASAVAISSIAIAIFGHFGAILAAVNPLQYQNAIYSWLWIDMGIFVIGGLTTALPFALDAAVSGSLGLTGIDVGKQVFSPSMRAIAGDIRAARAARAAAKAKGGKAA